MKYCLFLCDGASCDENIIYQYLKEHVLGWYGTVHLY